MDDAGRDLQALRVLRGRKQVTRPSQRALDLAIFGLEELNGQLRKDSPAGTSPHDVDRVFVRHKAPLLGALAELLDAAIQTANESSGPSSFKVEVQTGGDRAWSSNAQRFATREQADAAGKDLFARWIAMRGFRVVPSPDPPNQPLPGYSDGPKVAGELRGGAGKGGQRP